MNTRKLLLPTLVAVALMGPVVALAQGARAVGKAGAQVAAKARVDVASNADAADVADKVADSAQDMADKEPVAAKARANANANAKIKPKADAKAPVRAKASAQSDADEPEEEEGN